MRRVNIALIGLTFVLITTATSQTESAASPADIFFLDLGIVIEPATGNETYSRLVEAPSKEVQIQIKKVKSGTVYMAASKEMLAALERIQRRMDDLETSFQKEITGLREENKELRVMLAEFTAPPLPEPERPPVMLADVSGDLGILADMTAVAELPVVQVPPPVKLPPSAIVQKQRQKFDQTAYLSAVFAYEREDYQQALEYFMRLALEQANPRTRSNILYWIADSYQHLGDYEQALANLDKLLQSANASRIDDALIKKGLLYRKMGQEELALAAFQQVVNNYPDSEYLRLARMELRKAELIP
ncbi:MAG: tetratricopeptide repeat protein [FCB group bacterium]|nr:tetratricopeptide repeat protein [FCB group bacterium]